MKLPHGLILTAFLLLLPAVSCQSDYAGYARAEAFLPANTVSALYNMSVEPNWIEGTHFFWYIHSGRDGKEYILVDTKNATKKPAFDHEKLARALASASGEKIDHSNLTLSDVAFLDGKVEFSALNRTWQYGLEVYSEDVEPGTAATGTRKAERPGQTDALTEIKSSREPGPGELLSPDGRFAAFVRDHNLWVKDMATGKNYQLTTDGSEDYAYAERSGTVLHPISAARLNETAMPFAVWSPDSRRIATFQMDQRNVAPLNLLQYVPDENSRPWPWTYKFAMPDEEHVPVYEPVIIDVVDKKVLNVSYRPQPEVSLMDTDSNILQWWSDDGKVLYQLFAERGEKALRLLEIDPQNGQTKALLEEKGSTYVEANLDYASPPNVRILNSGDVIWFSEKDGYGHLYLYGRDGLQKSAITSGDWAVRKLLHVDENRSLVYFTAGGREPGRDPYFRHLYRINLNGSGSTLLTPENADHSIQISPDKTVFLDTYSRVDLPPVTVQRDLNGNITLTLEEGDIENLTRLGWKPPEAFSVKALDGKTDLYGLLIKPTGFNASKKYPVVETVYPGPWIIVTAKSFPGDLSWVNKIFWRGQALAELGFIVVTMDGPGTPYRSKEFHDASYGRLGDAGGLLDHINALRTLARDRPYMDLDRVGMFGHSAGGFMTAQALLSYPDFYKVGVASSGDYDSRFYGAFWGEKYEGPGADYAEQITSRKAANLTGDLLLVAGDVDDNVNPCMTMQMVDAFIEADKPFDLLVMTNRNHDLSYDTYYIHRMFDYFEEHLQNNGSAIAAQA